MVVPDGEQAFNCKDGYGLSSDNKCIACGKTPVTGTGNDGKNAVSGKWWEPWNSGTCTTCVANCETCLSKTTCQTCAAKYALATATSCVNCPANCDACSSGTVCTTCASGYRNNGATPNVCEACTVTNCGNCNTDKTKCDTCKAGFTAKTDKSACFTACTANQFNDAAGGKCDTCDANAATCTSSTVANTCKTGYFKTTAGKCETCTVSNCGDCLADKAKCTTCKAGFTVKDDKLTCFTDCTGGTFSDSALGTCTSCDAQASSCASKTAANACKTGYRLNAGKCEPCSVANCGNCNTSKDLCDTCLTKYAPATDKKS